MGMFWCQRCQELADSDDGCEDRAGTLICAVCMEELDDIAGAKEDQASMAREEQRLALKNGGPP
jgi:hypothetical protein